MESLRSAHLPARAHKRRSLLPVVGVVGAASGALAGAGAIYILRHPRLRRKLRRVGFFSRAALSLIGREIRSDAQDFAAELRTFTRDYHLVRPFAHMPRFLRRAKPEEDAAELLDYGASLEDRIGEPARA